MMDRLTRTSVALLLVAVALPGCLEASHWEFSDLGAQTVGRAFDGKDADGIRKELDEKRLLYDSRHRADLRLNGDGTWEATLRHREDSPAPVPLLASMVGGRWMLADEAPRSGTIEAELFLSEPAILAATAEVTDAATTAFTVKFGCKVELTLTMVRHDLEAVAEQVGGEGEPPGGAATFGGRVIYAGMAKVPCEGEFDFPVRITTKFTGTGLLRSSFPE